MKKIRLSKTNRINFATFGAVILAYAVFQFMSGAFWRYPASGSLQSP